MWPESGKIGESYETPENSAGWLGRLFPSLMYYSKGSPIVIRSAKEAQAGLYDRDAWASSSLEIFRNLESIGVRFHIENSAVLAKLKSPCVFVGNHMSTLETFVLPCMIQPHLEVTFVVKQSLMEYPVFNHVMRSCDPVVVNYKSRKADFRAMLIGGEERLKKGISMVVFPQGTRTTNFNPKTFNTLAIKIAKRASVPIVPIALRTDAWGSNGRWVRDFGKMRPSLPVHIAFGEPLHVEGYGRECQAQIIKFIDDRYRRWTEEFPIPEKW